MVCMTIHTVKSFHRRVHLSPPNAAAADKAGGSRLRRSSTSSLRLEITWPIRTITAPPRLTRGPDSFKIDDCG